MTSLVLWNQLNSNLALQIRWRNFAKCAKNNCAKVSETVVFLWILPNFWEHLRNPKKSIVGVRLSSEYVSVDSRIGKWNEFSTDFFERYWWCHHCKFTLHKKWSFPLRIPPVNVTKSAGKCGFGHITGVILKGKLHFLWAVRSNIEYWYETPNTFRHREKMVRKLNKTMLFQGNMLKMN